MQRLFFPLLLLIAASITSILPAAACGEDRQPRFGRALSQYAALSADQRETWLEELYRQRLEPACRACGDIEAYDRAVTQRQAMQARFQAGQQATTEELLEFLSEIDRQEALAIEHLAAEYRRVTHDAVGTDLVEFQRRMRLWKAIQQSCEQSPGAFENQPKLVWWLQAAITQQRISAAPPMPTAPDFLAANEPAGRDRGITAMPTTKTSLVTGVDDLNSGSLADRITRYNASLTELVTGLYDSRILNVEELDSTVDALAALALARVSLAVNAQSLAQRDRDFLPPVGRVDTAIALARVKVSAARRQINPEAQRDLSGSEWRTLEGLNRVAQRLSMLATGPDR